MYFPASITMQAQVRSSSNTDKQGQESETA